MSGDLFVWLPVSCGDNLEIAGSAFDDAGSEISLYDGMDSSDIERININIRRPGCFTDFVGNGRLLLIISSNLLDTIGTEIARDVEVVSVRLWGEGRKSYDGFNWLNVKHSFSLLDENLSSGLLKTKKGNYVRISSFRVKQDLQIGRELFRCEETRSKIFSPRIVESVRRAGLSGASFYRLDGAHWPMI